MNISTATNILCERTDKTAVSMADSIAACARAGFTALDFGFAELAFYSKQFLSDDWKKEIIACKQLAQAHGIKFVQGHGTIFEFCNYDETYQKKQIELLRRSLEGAQLLEIPWLVVHPCSFVVEGALSPETHEKNVAFFRSLSDSARSFGVGIAIENMWGCACPNVPRYAISAQEMKTLVEDIGCDNVAVCWDVEHASVERLAQGDSIRLLGKHIKVTHLSDETGPDNIHILPYTGLVKWEEILDAFAQIDYSGTFSLEIQHYLPSMPQALWHDAMCLAHRIGAHLVDQLKEKKHARACGLFAGEL